MSFALPAIRATYLGRWGDLQPRSAEPHQQLMDLLQTEGHFEGAIAAAERVLRIEQDNQEVQRRYVKMLLDEGRFREAETSSVVNSRPALKPIYMASMIACSISAPT